jgi:hypothetical protein
MKFLLSFLLIFLLSVSVMTSCTVEKRLYKRGYHIEWNKRAHVVFETESVSEKQVSDQVIREDEYHPETIVATPAPETITVTKKPAVQPETVLKTQDRASNTSESATATPTTNTDQQTETLGISHEQKSTLKKADHRPGSPSSNAFTRGLMLILIGLLLIGICFLFSSSVGPFGIALLLLFALVGLIIIAVGLFVMTFG